MTGCRDCLWFDPRIYHNEARCVHPQAPLKPRVVFARSDWGKCRKEMLMFEPKNQIAISRGRP